MRVLILGGTAEARRLASSLTGLPGVSVTSSLAGRTSTPSLPPGDVRIGGFGGVTGLIAWLRSSGMDAVIDATHPFAAVMSTSAAEACGEVGIPLLMLRRPGWIERDGDDWRRVPSIAAAARVLPHVGQRALLTTGRQTLGAFASLGTVWFLVRAVEAPAPPAPARMVVLLDRGPFTPAGEEALMRKHRIDVVVTKDSGSSAVEAKLEAARVVGIPVLMVDRPAIPAGVRTVPTVEDAVAWVVAAGG
ncbi:precorrin-6A/cobalt-precorrin-6A reductase [Catenuloplanes nepalensis]|uniref:Precorrin-6A/cobalt-precorrin-6A reductase n=1 Tax=Catenuloplanes nepalensis TaxID=587533 RepID=A0ABT9MWI0_9ACTN|nr:cobalt-precorrin-6A reductase [Catenuloplanes nepalensis]MDP9795793.1 precorrin-6A/cobalt-precorrin-6A reductase [Catenuloplanes nepalensis]